jgi:site-specific DNA-adenine methylase
MRYQGGKSRIAQQIAEIIQRERERERVSNLC